VIPESPSPAPDEFKNRPVRILKQASTDAGMRYFRPASDLRMLLTFLERFEHLGWFPPIDLEKRRLLAAHDVIMHVVRGDLCFYEFCSKGARGERQPWLSVFFHVDAHSTVRICGIVPVGDRMQHRQKTLDIIRLRVEMVQDRLERRKEK
jgi:hypothetical protein